MTNINEAALQSIEHYSRIEQIYTSMLHCQLEAAGTAADHNIQELAHLFREVNRTDSILKRLVNNNAARTDTTDKLIKEHGQILNQVHKLNQSLAVKAHNIKSLLHHELGKISAGRSAVNGYKQISTERKGIISGSL